MGEPDEKRVILIKPGDVLLIGGVQVRTAEEAGNALRLFREVAGIERVVFFADDIRIDSLTAEQIARLTTTEETRTDG